MVSFVVHLLHSTDETFERLRFPPGKQSRGARKREDTCLNAPGRYQL